MSAILKQSTAINMPVQALDSSGAPVTGKVTGDWTKRISKNGAAFGAMTVVVTEMENGWYQVALDTGHTDTVGMLAFTLIASGVRNINERFKVSADDVNGLSSRLPAALVSGRIDSSVGAIAADAITATAIQNNAITSAKIAASAIGATQLAADAITANKIADGAIDAATFAANAINAAALAADAATEIATAVAAPSAATIAAAVAAPSAATIAAAVAAPSASTIAAAVMASVTEGSRTVKGVLRRLDALVTGKATGLIGSVFALYAADGVTKLIEASQNIVTGARDTATTVAGE